MPTPATIRLFLGLESSDYPDERLELIISMAQEQADAAGVSATYSSAISDQIVMYLAIDAVSKATPLDPKLGGAKELEAGSVKLKNPNGGSQWRVSIANLDTRNLLGLSRTFSASAATGA